jgi:hypothetical protein
MIRTLQTNLTGGAISSDARDRLDLAVWKNSVADAENVRIHPAGGASRRPGLVHVDNAAGNGWYPGASYQIEPFIFSADQQYVFVFGPGVVNVYYKGSRTILEQLSGYWSDAMIANNELSVVQSFDTMLVFHKDVETVSYTRGPSGLFGIGRINYSYFNDGQGNLPRMPFHKYAMAHVAMWTDGPTNSPATGYVDLYTSDPVFQAGHMNTWINFRGVYLYIIGVIDPQFALAVMTNTIADWETHSTEWQEQAFSPVRGYARCGVRHEQRLWLGGGRDCPNTIWASTTYDPYNFYLGIGADTDAIKYTADTDRVAEIRRMVSYNHLQVFTADAEFYAPTPQSNALTPSTMALKQQSAYGIATAPAIRFDQTTIFISRAAGSVREFVYDNLQASYSADALTFMAKDYIRNPIDIDAAMETDYAQEALGIITNSDGTLAILSKVRKENVGAWMLWSTPGGVIRRVGVVQREIWAVVDRQNGAGTWIRGLEVFDANYMLDFAASWVMPSGTTSASYTFPYHANLELDCRSGDLYLGRFRADNSGTVTLPIATPSIEVGFAFEPLIVPLVQEVQMPDGLTWGVPKRICSTTISLNQTLSAQVDDDVLPTDNVEQDPGIAPDRFTGKFKAWRLGWGTEEAPVIKAVRPLPFNLTAIMMEVEV